MSEGTAVGGVCYASQSEAASRFCSDVYAIGPTGFQSCAGADPSAVLSPTHGGSASFPWVLETVDSSGAVVQQVVTTYLQSCERYDLAYWSPTLALWFVAMVSVFAARFPVRRFFTRDHD